MNIKVVTISDETQTGLPLKSEPENLCASCQALCCKLEVMILNETGVPAEFIASDEFGSETMRKGDDGQCIALNRDTNLCTIYENRPWVCRLFEMGSYECNEEREAHLV